MKITIEPYSPAFRRELCALWFDSFESAGLSHDPDTTVDSLLARLEHEIAHHDWHVFLAMDDGALLGFLAFEPRESYLNQLFIARSAQKKGIGKALLDFAKAQMPNGFRLRTDVENAGARRFYAREGLTLESVAPHPRFHHMTATYRWQPPAAG
jgi:GNAT superfamily N-acetyltransferase